MARPIVIVGVPTSLGGHLSGMERTPAGLRELGLVAALRARPLLGGAEVRDAGDLAIDPGFVADDDPRAKNRARICEFLPRERDLVASAVGGDADGPDDARLFDPRRRLHGPRRRDGRAPARPPGTTPGDRLVRRPRRLQHARHDAVGQRLGDALRDAVRARRPRPRQRRRRPERGRIARRAPRRAGARRGRVADDRRVEDRPFRGRDARRRRPASRRWPAGPPRSGARSTRSTSRSTWIASTRRAAGR